MINKFNSKVLFKMPYKFEGNVNLMIEIINDILYNTIYYRYKGIRQDDDYWWKL